MSGQGGDQGEDQRLEAELFARATRILSLRADSAAGLAAKLERKAGADHAPEALATAIEKTIQKLLGLKWLDDAAYAQGRAAHLHEKGKPRWAVAADLAQQGVARALIDEALEAIGDDETAARRWLKRKRRGPFRRAGAADEARDLRALARAGFSREAAARALAGAEGSEDG